MVKNFIKESWFKICIGVCGLLVSTGFFIRSINPSFANMSQTPEKASTLAPAAYSEGNYIYFIDNGYLYQIQKGDMHMAFTYAGFFNSMAKPELLEDPVTKVKRKSYFAYRKINK
jgi:hypothetical protein